MTLKIRKVQRESQSVLLVVHDRSGASHDLIEKCTKYLSEVLAQPQEPDPRCIHCNGTGELITGKDGITYPSDTDIEPAGGGSIHECICMKGVR